MISFNENQPEVLDNRMSMLSIRAMLLRAPREAMIRYEELISIDGLDSGPELMDKMVGLPGAPSATRTLGQADLAKLRAAFQALLSSATEARLGDYVAELRNNYILDREMAKQAGYFEVYAREIIEHVKQLPILKQTSAKNQIEYLAQDLQDTKVATLEELGRQLAVLLE
jgi:hypothetical protein